MLPLLLALTVQLPNQPQPHSCQGSFPKNRFHISEFAASGISKKTFNEIINKMETTWAPAVASRGGKLVFNNLWADGTVNSDTDVEGDNWVVNAYGGLARFPGMTADAYTLVACHELGHHFGGAPLFTDDVWASVEGEADYFATIKCMKVMFGASAKKRIAQASLVVATTLAKMGEEPTLPHFNTPDPSVVSQTFESHPEAQCRLDTYMAGIACGADGNFSMTDPRPGSCYDYDTKVGARPLCWFKP